MDNKAFYALPFDVLQQYDVAPDEAIDNIVYYGPEDRPKFYRAELLEADIDFSKIS